MKFFTVLIMSEREVFICVEFGQTDMIMDFIKSGVNMEKCQYGFPLGIASSNGYLDVVTILLDNGVSANTNINGTALHSAAEWNETAIISKLLEHGARPDIYHGDYLPIHIAILECQHEAVELLIKHTPNCLTKSGKTLVQVVNESDYKTEKMLKIISG